MTEIAANLNKIKTQVEQKGARLIAVSKTKPIEDIMKAYEAGHRDFGENKAQEMTTKYEQLPKDIRWHMIGHLQRNKVKFIAPFVYLIHSVDSVRLLKAINKEATKNDRVINCLLQVHIAEESNKFGFDQKELEDFLNSGELEDMSHIRVVGLMGMATFTENQEQVSREFAGLRTLLDDLADRYDLANFELTELSMGMSGDYPIAQSHGSTLVRVGSAIFGERNYG